MAHDEVVRLVDIKKTYYTGGNVAVPVLKGIDAVIRRGSFVGIMGVSGSGKSTLLNILGLLDVPSTGQYFLDGQEVEFLTDDDMARIRNRSIGFIFQGFNLFPHLTVEQNIEVPMVYASVPRAERRERARTLAARVGLGHRLDHRPNQLSGGECQRIAIARSLSNNPHFLLADEPTGNLDEKTGDEIMRLFHELNANGMTIFMVTHNPELENEFHEVIRLRDGRLCDYIAPEEFA
jgi:putative ABC transport system ATP-binding protein